MKRFRENEGLGGMALGILLLAAALALLLHNLWEEQNAGNAAADRLGALQEKIDCISKEEAGQGIGLPELEGDRVYFTGADGTVTAYQVKKIEILKPGEIRRMTESSYALTLYTCTWGGAARVTVRCRRFWSR